MTMRLTPIADAYRVPGAAPSGTAICRHPDCARPYHAMHLMTDALARVLYVCPHCRRPDLGAPDPAKAPHVPVTDAERLARRDGARALVLTILQTHGPMTYAMLVRQCGLKPALLSVTLVQLRRAGRLRRTQQGRGNNRFTYHVVAKAPC